MVYSIGYAHLNAAAFRRMVMKLDVLVVDVRASARSRVPGFGKLQLGALLGEHYVHIPELGGRERGVTKAGLYQLDELTACTDCMLMCMEEAPGDCHRHWQIALLHYPETVHIFRDEMFTAQALHNAIQAGPAVPYEPCGSLRATLKAGRLAM